MLMHRVVQLENQTVLSAFLDHLTNGRLALGSKVALFLTLQQLFYILPHAHLLHVGPVALLHLLLLLTKLLLSRQRKPISLLACL